MALPDMLNPAESAALLHVAFLQLYRSKDAEVVVQGLRTMVSFDSHATPEAKMQFTEALLRQVIVARTGFLTGGTQLPILTEEQVRQVWQLAQAQNIVPPNTDRTS